MAMDLLVHIVKDRAHCIDDEHCLGLGQKCWIRVRHARFVPQRVQRVQNGGESSQDAKDVVTARAQFTEGWMAFSSLLEHVGQ